MRVLVMHSSDQKIQQSAAALKKALEQEGCRVDSMSSADAGSAPVSTAPYALVLWLWFKGWWKPQIPTEVDNLLKRATRLEGKTGAAFVQAKIDPKSTKGPMAYMGTARCHCGGFGTSAVERKQLKSRRLKR